MDEQDKKHSGYDDLIGEGIDSLNEAGTYAGTRLEKEKTEVKSKSPLSSIWFKVLIAVTIISVGVSFYYYQSQAGRTLTEEEAEEDLKSFFGEDYEALSESDST